MSFRAPPPDRALPNATWTIGEERRAHERYGVNIPGHLFLPCTGQKIACQIVDLSDGGARVVLPSPEPLPQVLKLFESRNSNAFECQLRWQAENQAGLYFVDMCLSGERARLLKELKASR